MPITINGSTGISGVDGSAGTPALIGSDADTGIFLAAGQVSASVNGTAGNVPLVSGTAQASTSGTSIDFTGIPSWVKRITVMLSGVSTNGTSNLLIQIGSGGFTTTGYASEASQGTDVTSTIGFLQTSSLTAGSLRTGLSTIVSLGSSIYVCAGVIADTTATGSAARVGGTVTLSGTLDRIRITTVGGTDTFDAGTINIMYE